MPAYSSYQANLSFSNDERTIYRSRGFKAGIASQVESLPEMNGYVVQEASGYYKVVNLAKGETVHEGLFRTIQDAKDYMNSLPSCLTWEQELEQAGIPLKGTGTTYVAPYERGYALLQEGRWGARPIGDNIFPNAKMACLAFWAYVEEMAQSNKQPYTDSSTKERFISYGESPDNFIDWVINGYPPREYWELFE